MIASKDRSGWFGASDVDKIVGNYNTKTWMDWWLVKMGVARNDIETVAMNAGTAAIHMALRAIGISEGDIVFCQSMTFSASANPIVYQNATPVFIDSEPDTWNMSPEALREALRQPVRFPTSASEAEMPELTTDC